MASSTLDPPGRAFTARVERVVDGDTFIAVRRGERLRVRLIGVDAPESVKPGAPVECWGPESSRLLHRLLPVDSVVTGRHQDGGKHDIYGRDLWDVWLPDGRFLQAVLGAQGRCRCGRLPAAGRARPARRGWTRWPPQPVAGCTAPAELTWLRARPYPDGGTLLRGDGMVDVGRHGGPDDVAAAAAHLPARRPAALRGAERGPGVTEFLGGPVSRDESDSIAEYAQGLHAREGIGLLAVERAEDGVFLGMCGLHHVTDWDPDIEVGLAAGPRHWGTAYATEAAAAWLRHGFTTLDLPRVISITDREPPNVRSMAVTRRLGMVHDHDADLVGRDGRAVRGRRVQHHRRPVAVGAGSHSRSTALTPRRLDSCCPPSSSPSWCSCSRWSRAPPGGWCGGCGTGTSGSPADGVGRRCPVADPAEES